MFWVFSIPLIKTMGKSAMKFPIASNQFELFLISWIRTTTMYKYNIFEMFSFWLSSFNMKLLVFLALFGLVAAAAAEGFVSPINNDYHETVGIPAAARIRAAEEAMDFDGSRIVGGSAAALGQYPYLVSVLKILQLCQLFEQHQI